MPARIGKDGKARKVPDIIGDPINHPYLDVPPELEEAIRLMQQDGLTEEEIQRELQILQQQQQIDPVQQSRIPPVSAYPSPMPPLSQQTMDRLHVPAHKPDNDPVAWVYKGEAIRHRQFLQVDGPTIQQMVKDDITLALLRGRNGGFSAAEDLAYIIFDKQISQKSRVDLGGIPERLATVAQYNISKQMFEESPERPKESKSFLRGIFGGK